MEKTRALEKLNKFVEDIKSIPYPDNGRVEQEVLKALSYAKGLIPDDREFSKRISDISFTPFVVFGDESESESEYMSALESGKNQLIGIINAMISHVDTFYPDDPITDKEDKFRGNDVFIVHGHDNEMIHNVARTVTDLSFNPIILREQPNHGLTIIEKFEAFSNVGFAIILLAPDDELMIKDKSSSEYAKEISRSRQNVLFEMGFFIGKLGRNRVIALHKATQNFEFPSDYSGVIYVSYDSNNNWKFEIGKEMKAAGLSVDLNKLV
jgi:predicted nucleotide-binding protein